MNRHFILHERGTNKPICVSWSEFSSEGSPGEPGTTVWWTDDQGNKRSATFEESFNQINEIMEKLLKYSVDGLENSCQPDTQQ